MNQTKRVNIFDQTVREIRCIAKEHDYLGTGELFVEEELEVGKIYTMLRGRAGYGNMVFLKELPAKYGYQSYLFEELKPYDEEIIIRKNREWLLAELDKGLESARKGGWISSEEIDMMIEEWMRFRPFEPGFSEGHEKEDAYWIMPVTVRDCARIEFSDINEFRQHEISIPGRYFDILLTSFFTDGIDPDLSINKHRYSTDDVSEGFPVYGFEWYMNPNFYTYDDMRKIIERMKMSADLLRSGHIDQMPFRQKKRLRMEFAEVAEDESAMTYKDAMNVTADFYIKLADRLLQMMEECRETDVICVTAP